MPFLPGLDALALTCRSKCFISIPYVSQISIHYGNLIDIDPLCHVDIDPLCNVDIDPLLFNHKYSSTMFQKNCRYYFTIDLIPIHLQVYTKVGKVVRNSNVKL